MYAACRQAAKVTCLEPEAAGSTTGAARTFSELKRQMGIDTISMLTVKFEDFDPGGDKFDVIVMENSINHLDEGACIALHCDAQARATYCGLFKKLRDLSNPGAHLIVSDVARRNLIGDLGLKNPFVPAIEWHKHQSPSLWADVLADAGFCAPWIRWETFNTLRKFGVALLCTKFAAYLLLSRFILVMRTNPNPIVGEVARS